MPTYSGFSKSVLFNPAGTRQTNARIKLVTWNCRALLHANRRLRERKLAILRKLANDADIIFLQEVHWELTLFEVTLRDVCQYLWVSHSF